MKLILLDPHGSIVKELDISNPDDHLEAIRMSPKCYVHMGCQSGRCGSCLFKTSNIAAFEQPTSQEEETLRSMSAKPNERLACISRMKTTMSGTVHVWNAFTVYKPDVG